MLRSEPVILERSSNPTERPTVKRIDPTAPPIPPTHSCLTPIRVDETKAYVYPSTAFWLCECSCGKMSSVKRSKIIDGHTLSCGHLQKERAGGVLGSGNRRSKENAKSGKTRIPPALLTEAVQMTGFDRKTLTKRIKTHFPPWSAEGWAALNNGQRLAAFVSRYRNRKKSKPACLSVQAEGAPCEP